MEKIDFKKRLKHLYQPLAKEVVCVDVPTFNYLMIDGEGDPNISQAYANAVETLFILSYTLKFQTKKSKLAVDYGVMPLEGLWWADDMSKFTIEDKSSWKWTMMIFQPDFITQKAVDLAITEVKKKKSLPALSRVRFEPLSEGTCAQILHIGPFTEEVPTIEKAHAFIEKLKLKCVGKHHEIYLSDIRKADPRKWKTIIRQPMR